MQETNCFVRRNNKGHARLDAGKTMDITCPCARYSTCFRAHLLLCESLLMVSLGCLEVLVYVGEKFRRGDSAQIGSQSPSSQSAPAGTKRNEALARGGAAELTRLAFRPPRSFGRSPPWLQEVRQDRVSTGGGGAIHPSPITEG